MRTIIIPLLLIVLLGLISFNATNLMEYGQDLELAKTNKAATLKIFNDCQIKKCKSNTDPCSDKKCHDQLDAHSACIKKTKTCEDFAALLKGKKGNELLDKSFFSCAKTCKPDQKASAVFYKAYSCAMDCAWE